MEMIHWRCSLRLTKPDDRYANDHCLESDMFREAETIAGMGYHEFREYWSIRIRRTEAMKISISQRG